MLSRRAGLSAIAGLSCYYLLLSCACQLLINQYLIQYLIWSGWQSCSGVSCVVTSRLCITDHHGDWMVAAADVSRVSSGCVQQIHMRPACRLVCGQLGDNTPKLFYVSCFLCFIWFFCFVNKSLNCVIILWHRPLCSTKRTECNHMSVV